MNKLLAAVLTLSPALALAQTSTWSADPAHSQVGFGVKHLVISTVRGEFQKYDGKLILDEKDLTRSSVEATIDVDSINTKVADRDAHLKSPDFFDAQQHPKMTFKSTKVQKAGKDKLKVKGDLTLRGVTKPVVLDVAFTPEVKGMFGETRRAFAATTKISRKDFGLAWNNLVEKGPVVGDEVTINLELEFVKDQPKASATAN